MIAWRMEEGRLPFIMAMKVLTGMIVGVLTGFVRKKSGSVYDAL